MKRLEPFPCRRVAAGELGGKMRAFETELPVRDQDCEVAVDGHGDSSLCEAISASCGFFPNDVQIRADGARRVCERAEALQLRVIAVPARCAGEYFLRQQTLTPERHEPFGVQVTGM